KVGIETMSGTYVHPLALVESEIGDDTRVWAFAHIMKGARVGRGCNVGEGVYIEAGGTVGDDVTIKNGVALYSGITIESSLFLGPHCVFTNDRRPRSGKFKHSPDHFESTVVQWGATVGANATVVCGATIGTYAMVAAGAVVTRSVAPFALVVGVPAKGAG